MTSTFTLRLDTTAPSGATIALNGGAAYATVRAVTANLHTDDADVTLVKLWGDVDGTVNPNIQPTEAASSFIPYSTAVALTLSAGDGAKVIYAKLRDDVGNVTAQISDAINLDTTAPTVSITVPFVTAFTATDGVPKISEVAGFNKADGTFQVNSDIQRWEVRVVPSIGSAHTAGTLIGTTHGSTGVSGGVADSGNVALAATTNQVVQIDGSDLKDASSVDGDKIVKIFVQDIAGNWSP